MILSTLLIACVNKVPPLEIPPVTGDCEKDMKAMMRYYVLPDQKMQHIK